MIAEWYEIPADQTEWEESLPVELDPEDDRQFVVVFEDVTAGETGEGPGFEAQATISFGKNGTEFYNSVPFGDAPEWRAQSFVYEVQPHAEAVGARVRKKPGRLMRVFIGLIERALPSDVCARCIALVKLALRSIKVLSGGVGPDDVFEMADNLNIGIPEWLTDFLNKAFGEAGMWDQIKAAARRIGRALRWMDRLAQAICEDLDKCPSKEAVP
ncbi:hypothetical protein CD351_11765 [Erythrobacter sp. KY5]|uniref:hypothetical protein n=1 Tax=Erythrobacter sp. KY5 TaxID=2011159 RepID=UPI000DBEF319|nr:hypothetical protein [Erythrobacter sp. KY5]AWW75104.1 hypothetical protein CD351_11765 [Erythrobacter sp. KY5]